MGAGFHFEIGVFADGFVPTAQNVHQWSSHWSVAQSTTYNETNRWFTAVFEVTDNAAPFVVGANAYVWGYSGDKTQGEWILFRASAWTWPEPNPLAPMPVLWSAKDAGDVVLGSVERSGSPYLLRSAAVTIPSTTWAQFRDQELAGIALNAPNDDADGDSASNALEFAVGTDPKSATDGPETTRWGTIAESGGKKYLQVRVPRRQDRAVSVTAEVSPDGRSWISGNVADTVENTASAIVLRDKTPVGEGNGQRFLRARVTPLD